MITNIISELDTKTYLILLRKLNTHYRNVFNFDDVIFYVLGVYYNNDFTYSVRFKNINKKTSAEYISVINLHEKDINMFIRKIKLEKIKHYDN